MSEDTFNIREFRDIPDIGIFEACEIIDLDGNVVCTLVEPRLDVIATVDQRRYTDLRMMKVSACDHLTEPRDMEGQEYTITTSRRLIERGLYDRETYHIHLSGLGPTPIVIASFLTVEDAEKALAFQNTHRRKGESM